MMKRLYSGKPFILPVIAGVILVVVLLFADPVQVGSPSWPLVSGSINPQGMEIRNQKQEIQKYIDRYAGASWLPDVAVAMVKGDKTVFMYHTAGERRFFEAASLTKSITALSVLILADRGEIDLDEPVSRYMDFPLKKKVEETDPVTARHLLHHTSGLNNSYVYIRHEGERVLAPVQTVPAGYRVFYSNSGYNSLGELVEALSGMNLGQYVRKNILEPLDWDVEASPADMKGSMGFYFSIRDMADYLTFLIREGSTRGNRLVSESTFRQIYRKPVPLVQADNRDYRGACWNVWEKKGKIFSIYHGGLWRNAGGFVQVFPEEEVGYAILSDPPDHSDKRFNRFYRGLKGRLAKLANYYFKSDERAEEFRVSKPSGKDLERYEGTYYNSRMKSTIHIESYLRGYLVARQWGRGRMLLLPMTGLNFVHFDEDDTHTGKAFDFVLKEGKVAGVATARGYYRKIRYVPVDRAREKLVEENVRR
jgi:CubicO group peptidase (beta-lactamase class C family)